ncbi:MAG: TMEM175 family protein [Hyphomonadaceae bacterium]|nr:TMEM175 family protein [Hyphomonadaceae bacterium]
MAGDIAEPPLSEAGRARIDNFVDSAFAFAVTLLVIATDAPPTNVEELKAALLKAPGFAMGFALVAMFWWTHRSYARVRPEGAVPLLISLAIVFVMLVYVYPLRLFADVFVAFVTGDAQAGGSPVRTLATMRDLYLIYGAGFTALAVLFTVAFAHAGAAARGRGDDAVRRYAGDGAAIWVVLVMAGALSIGLAAAVPFDTPLAVGLPGMAYALIPVGVGIVTALRARSGAQAR